MVKQVEVESQEQPPVAEVVEIDEPVIVAPLTKRARVKGTWTQYYGQSKWEFVDKEEYNLPIELFDYLKSRGNIYDVMF